MKLKCLKEIEGFTVGKTYKVLSCAGEYVLLKDDTKEKVIIHEGCFNVVK